MTLNQTLQILGVFFDIPLFAALLITLIGTLTYIDSGEYKKAAFTSAICVVLAMVILAVIIAVF